MLNLRKKVGKDACGKWQGICGTFCSDDTHERGFRLLEFATINDLVLASTFGHHKASRRWTWHSQNGQHHNQNDYIIVRKRFWSGVNSARTWSFPGTDIGSDHDLLMMTFRLRLRRSSKPKHTRLKSDLKKLKDPNVLEAFQTMIGGKFAPLTKKTQAWIQWSPPSPQQSLKQPVRSVANIVRRGKKQQQKTKKTWTIANNSWSVRQN